MQTPDFLGWVKRSDIGIVLIELSELVVFNYGPCDTQDNIRCLRNGIYILWLTSSPCDKNSGEQFRAHGPSCLLNWPYVYIHGTIPRFKYQSRLRRKNLLIFKGLMLVGWFCCFTSQVNSYGHCRTVSSPNHTFSWAGLNKRLTSNSCIYFRL